MKIVAALNNVKEAGPLIQAGADELFCGVLDKKWIGKYTNSFPCNKRSRPNTSLSSFEELKECYETVASFGKEITFLLNNFFVQSQKSDVLSMLDKAIKIGIRNFIITDPLMIKKVDDAGLNAFLSCTSPVFNSEAARFYRQEGIKRIILPRDLGMDEIRRITSKVKLEYEIIIINEGCSNIDGLCRFFHGKDKKGEYVPLACSLSYETRLKTTSKDRRSSQRKHADLTGELSKKVNSNYCGACFIPDLEKAGVGFLKIPGRGWPTELKTRDIMFIKLLMGKAGSHDYKTVAKAEYGKVYNHPCGNKCYFRG